MSYFCAQRGCQFDPLHNTPMCPVCNNPLQGTPPEPTPAPTPEPTPAPTPAAPAPSSTSRKQRT